MVWKHKKTWLEIQSSKQSPGCACGDDASTTVPFQTWKSSGSSWDLYGDYIWYIWYRYMIETVWIYMVSILLNSILLKEPSRKASGWDIRKKIGCKPCFPWVIYNVQHPAVKNWSVSLEFSCASKKLHAQQVRWPHIYSTASTCCHNILQVWSCCGRKAMYDPLFSSSSKLRQQEHVDIASMKGTPSLGW